MPNSNRRQHQLTALMSSHRKLESARANGVKPKGPVIPELQAFRRDGTQSAQDDTVLALAIAASRAE